MPLNEVEPKPGERQPEASDQAQPSGEEKRSSALPRAGRITFAGLAFVVLGGVLIVFSRTAGVVVVLLGLLVFAAGLVSLLSRLKPPPPRPGERPPVKYGPTILGTVLRAMDPRHGESDDE